jgi:phage protein D
VTQAAKARGVRHVIVVRTPHTKRWREVVEGDIAKDIARKLGSEVNVEGVSP